jgi:hypothetical protein
MIVLLQTSLRRLTLNILGISYLHKLENEMNVLFSGHRNAPQEHGRFVGGETGNPVPDAVRMCRYKQSEAANDFAQLGNSGITTGAAGHRLSRSPT